MRKHRIILPFLLLMILAACQAHMARSPEAIYTGTRAAFNNYLELYLDYRDQMPPGPDKDALRAKMEPLFEKGEKALDAYGSAVGTENEFIKERAFNTIFDMVVFELMERGVIK